MFMQCTVILNHNELKKGMVVTVLESLMLGDRPHHLVQHPILKINVAIPASKTTCPKIVRNSYVTRN